MRCSARCRLAVACATSAMLLSLDAPTCADESASASELEACFSAAERAQPLMRQRRLREARTELEICAREVCPRIARTDCRTWLAEVASGQPSILIAPHEVRGPEVHDLHGVRAIVDGAIVVENADATQIAIDPGPHRVRVERSNAQALEQDIEVRDGERGRIVNFYWHAPEVAALSRPIPALVYVAGSIGVAALSMGAYLEFDGLSRRGSLNSSCQPTRTCAQSVVDSARNITRAGDVTLGAGLLLLAVAGYVYSVRPMVSASLAGNRLEWVLSPALGGLIAGLRGSL
jgi:hypothetical protein